MATTAVAASPISLQNGRWESASVHSHGAGCRHLVRAGPRLSPGLSPGGRSQASRVGAGGAVRGGGGQSKEGGHFIIRWRGEMGVRGSFAPSNSVRRASGQYATIHTPAPRVPTSSQNVSSSIHASCTSSTAATPFSSPSAPSTCSFYFCHRRPCTFRVAYAKGMMPIAFPRVGGGGKDGGASGRLSSPPAASASSSSSTSPPVLQRLQEGVPPKLLEAITASLDNCLTDTQLDADLPASCGIAGKVTGKVRDTYTTADGKLVLVTTDRQSAFDRVLASIPFKGQVLNQTSAWWFENTRHIIPNAFLSAPDPNVTIAKTCKVFPVEFVVRGYLTGSTSTSIWTLYSDGARGVCGNALPDGMVKNQLLAKNMITPTTKAVDHDWPITPQEIVEQGLMSEADWNYASEKALELFAFGQEVAASQGLLLVDTKYEMGKTADGTIVLLDEIHTPDSSRYWIADSYESRFAQGLEPDNIDKEFLRLWFRNNCDPYNDPELPPAPVDLVVELSRRYILLYEAITGVQFVPPNVTEPIQERIARNVQDAL